ncbi:hypothetical protein LOD99_6656 [Oopsacas minuta]|uniref:Uncharacterized protein n=1 Tax=Oopsacas minuta TaxID=111878 RepID=A0AAV7JL17_9METZ|nr:hypothetical protein LOD99_6656 [Oopsacas minuta]
MASVGCVIAPPTETQPPDFDSPLIIEPKQPQNVLTLGNLAPLVGTWVNAPNTFGYNVMPLPQMYDETGGVMVPSYILKNNQYYEEMTFSAINGVAPNRGGQGTQVCNTLFYEQRVYLSENPDQNKLLHAENGSWLNFTSREQFLGPYGQTPLPNSTPPVLLYQIGKQMSVPHGNSILAVGTSSIDKSGRQPDIPDIPLIKPQGVNTSQYDDQSVGNPNVTYTSNPNLVIQQGLTGEKIAEYIKLEVDSKPVAPPTNIGFEQKFSKVTSYKQTVWIIASKDLGQFDRLLYSQTIGLQLIINGTKVEFPHVTSNALVRKTF